MCGFYDTPLFFFLSLSFFLSATYFSIGFAFCFFKFYCSLQQNASCSHRVCARIPCERSTCHSRTVCASFGGEKDPQLGLPCPTVTTAVDAVVIYLSRWPLKNPGCRFYEFSRSLLVDPVEHPRPPLEKLLHRFQDVSELAKQDFFSMLLVASWSPSLSASLIHSDNERRLLSRLEVAASHFLQLAEAQNSVVSGAKSIGVLQVQRAELFEL